MGYFSSILFLLILNVNHIQIRYKLSKRLPFLGSVSLFNLMKLLAELNILKSEMNFK